MQEIKGSQSELELVCLEKLLSNLTDGPMIKARASNFANKDQEFLVSKDQFYCFRAQKGISSHKSVRYIDCIYNQL
jgi:hypothetical protein